MRRKHGESRVSTFAKRLASVSASPTLTVAAEAERLRRAGFDVVDFSAGEPDFPTPAHVKTAGKAAIDANFTRYTVAPGIPELREAICARYRQDYGVDIAPTEVLITVGGKQALFNAALALVRPGRRSHHPRSLLADHSRAGEADGRDARHRHHADRTMALRFTPTPMIAAITPKTKAIILNSPSNPTGALIDEEHRRSHRRCGCGARHLDHRRPVLRAARVRPSPAQSAQGALRAPSQSDGAGRLGIERVRDDRMALRMEHCAEGVDGRVERDSGAVDLEHHLDHTEGGARGDQGPAGCRLRHARRVSTGGATAFTAG